MTSHRAIIIGGSAGCLDALSAILPSLPADYPVPILVVVHLPAGKESLIAGLLDAKCALSVCEAEDKMPIQSGNVYFAPPDYHMLIEKEQVISLSNEDEVLYSRPSIDVSFESAADVYGAGLTGIVLTGANNDGAAGLDCIVAEGGAAIVQDPGTAHARAMPEAAIKACPSAQILSLPAIADYLKRDC